MDQIQTYLHPFLIIHKAKFCQFLHCACLVPFEWGFNGKLYLASVFAPFSVKFSLRKRTVLWVDEIDALTLETQIQSHTFVLGLVQVVSFHGGREREMCLKKKKKIAGES